MLIKVLSKFGYQTKPIVTGMIDVDENDLKKIGISKQFDTKNNRLIDYVPDTAKATALQEIENIKVNLTKTDYQAIKYAEGVMSEEEYIDIKNQRQAWRARINELEAQYGLQTS